MGCGLRVKYLVEQVNGSITELVGRASARAARTAWHIGSRGRSPHQIQPLPAACVPSVFMIHFRLGAFVYRLGRGLLKAERRVRFPYALPVKITTPIPILGRDGALRRPIAERSVRRWSSYETGELTTFVPPCAYASGGDIAARCPRPRDVLPSSGNCGRWPSAK